MTDAVRLALGTLTVLPVRAPARVDRNVAGWAMVLAPVVGGVLALPVTVVAWLLLRTGVGPLLAAVLAVGLLATLTRLIHWDGLADTADGLGSGRPAEAALTVMRRSDVGPFGVFAVVLVALAQVAALAELLAAGAVAAALVAAVLGRLALPIACRRGVPAARRDGLGAAVAGSVGAVRLAVAVAVTVVLLAAVVLVDPDLGVLAVGAAAVASIAWTAAGTTYLRRRLTGMTGDTLGALVETSTTVTLVVLAVG